MRVLIPIIACFSLLFFLALMVALDARGSKNKWLKYGLGGVYVISWVAPLLLGWWLCIWGDAPLKASVMLVFTGIVLGILAAVWFRKIWMKWLGSDSSRWTHSFVFAVATYIVLILFSKLALVSEEAMPFSPNGQAPRVPVEKDFLAFLLGAADKLFLLLLAVVGVGWPLYRNRKAVIARLRLQRVSVWKTFVIILFCYPILKAVDPAAAWLWEMFFPQPAMQLEAGSGAPLLALTIPNLLYTLVGTVFLTSVAEEIFYRGALQPRLGIVCSSFLFAIAHTNAPPPELIALFTASLLYGLLAKHYGLWLTIGLHMVHNIVGSLGYFVGVRDAEWLALLRSSILVAGLLAYSYAIFYWFTTRGQVGSFFYAKNVYQQYATGVLLSLGAIVGAVVLFCS